MIDRQLAFMPLGAKTNQQRSGEKSSRSLGLRLSCAARKESALRKVAKAPPQSVTSLYEVYTPLRGTARLREMAKQKLFLLTIKLWFFYTESGNCRESTNTRKSLFSYGLPCWTGDDEVVGMLSADLHNSF